MDNEFTLLADNQRALWKMQADTQRAEAHRRYSAAVQSLCWDIYFAAELGPMYAMLNPDPRAYAIARKYADKTQSCAIEALTRELHQDGG